MQFFTVFNDVTAACKVCHWNMGLQKDSRAKECKNDNHLQINDKNKI